MESFNDRHLLVGIIVSGAEQDTKASGTRHFFDALQNIAEERIVNRSHHQADDGQNPRQNGDTRARRVLHALELLEQRGTGISLFLCQGHRPPWYVVASSDPPGYGEDFWVKAGKSHTSTVVSKLPE